MVFCIFDYSLSPHLSYLGGKSAPLDLQIIGKLLAVKRNIELVFPALLGNHYKIAQQLLSRGTLCRNLDFFVKSEIFKRKIFHKIEYQPLMEAAVILTRMQNMRAINKHYIGVFISHDRNRNSINLGTGKLLCKNLRGQYLGEYASVAVIIKLYSLNRAG